MADASKIVEILFAAKDGVTPVIKGIGKSIDGLDKAVGPFENIAASILKVEAAATTLAVGGLALAITKFASFEDVLLKVKGITGANEEEYNKLKETAKDLGRTTAFTAKQAAEGLQFLTQAGISLKESQEALPTVLNLASASALDLGKTADIVTNIMAGYGIQVEDLTKASDTLTATFTGSNTNLDQLGQAFKFVGPVAKSLGVSFEETSAALGLLGNAGYQAEQGGTALRNILLALVAPTTNMGRLLEKLGVSNEEFGVNLIDSKNALQSLGIQVKGANGELKPLSTIMSELSKALGDIEDPADRAATAVNIFGKRGGPQLLALLEQGTPALEDMKKRISEAGDITKKIADDMESGLGGALRRLNSAYEGFFIDIGDKLKFSSIENLTAIFNALSDNINDKAFDPVFKAIDALDERIGDVLGKIAENLPKSFKNVDFNDFIKSLNNVADAVADSIESILGGVDISTADGLTKAIQYVIDTLALLNNITAGIIDSWQGFIETVTSIIKWFDDLDESTQKSIGSFLGFAQQAGAVLAIAASLSLVIKGLGFAFSGAGTSIKALGPILTGVGAALPGLISNSKAFALTFAKWGSGIVTAGSIGAALGTLLREIPGVDEGMQGLIERTDKFFNLGLGGKSNTREELDAYAEAIEKFKKRAEEGKKATDAYVESLQELSTVNVDNVEKKIDDLVKKQEELLDKIQETFKAELGADQETKVKLSLDRQQFKDEYAKTQDELTRLQEERKIAIKLDATQLEDGKKKFKELETIELLPVKVPVDSSAVDEAAKDIEEKIPAEKRLKIETDLKIEEIRAQAETLQTAFEWEAKLDIATVEADAEKVKSAFDSINVGIEDTGKLVSSLISQLGETDYFSPNFQEIKAQLDLENDLRQRSFELQQELTQAQIEYMNLQTERLSSGEPLINVTTDGLAPHLQMVVESLVEYIQIQGATEGLQSLLGLTVT